MFRVLTRVLASKAKAKALRDKVRQAQRVNALVRLTLLSRYLHRRRTALEARVPPAVRASSLPRQATPKFSVVLRQLSEVHWHRAVKPSSGDKHDAVLRRLVQAEAASGFPDAHNGHASRRFEDVAPDMPFEGIERCDTLSLDRLRAFDGEEVIEKLRACRQTYADKDNYSGANGRLLRKIAAGGSRIKAVKDIDPMSPVSLFTPLSAQPYAAVAAVDIAEGEPIAQYAGELLREDDEEPASNTYLYELDPAEMRERGYAGRTLRINARNGGLARFINDRWAADGLPERTPNCFSALVFDGKAKLPRMVVYATAAIPAGHEVIIDYGPDYWKVTTKVLLEEHAADAHTNHEHCARLEAWLAANESQR